MKTPSRLMPAYEPKNEPIRLVDWLLFSGIGVAFGYLVWREPWLLGIVPIVILFGYFKQVRIDKVFSALNEKRKEQSICEFARSFQRHSVDTWVIRAVYEEVQKYVSPPGMAIPLQATDTLLESLGIESDDLEMDLVEIIAFRSGRSLKEIESNPFAGKVDTVGELVHFFNAQPREKSHNVQ